ncbi:MAG: endonuclease [Planctomycetota bacterium]
MFPPASRRRVLGALGLVCVLAPSAVAQIPPGYYDTVDTSNAAALRATLHDVIDDHVRVPYTSGGTDTWDVLEDAQTDPANSGSVLDVYLNASYPKQGGGGANYNREHVWPNSFGFPNDSGTNYPYTDCHALRLCDITYNQVRDNAIFDDCSPSADEYPTLANGGQGGGSGTYPGNSNWQEGTGSNAVFEVWKGRRGDVARAMLYLDVRYEGGTNGDSGASEPDLVLTDDTGLILASQTGQNESVAYMGLLSVLLQWHAADPVDQFEKDRNDTVYGYQGNRNPFVDHPEWVGVLWQGATLSPQLSVDSPTLDLTTGGTVHFSLDAGSQYGGKLYLMAGSASGTSPGLALSPPFPLNYDNYMLLTLQNPNGIIAGSLSVLDGAGHSTASLSVPPLVFSHLAGGHLDHAYMVFDIPGTTLALAASNPVGLDLVASTPSAGGLVVNEIDYDQPSTDFDEFVEILNTSSSTISLANYTLDLVNGSNDTVYDTIALSAAGATIAPGQYLVIGTTSVTSALPAGVLSIDFANASNAIQNGAPDGVVLRENSTVVDSVAYEGTMPSAGEGGAAPTDPGVGSIARFPNGADTDDNAVDFVFTTTSTPGAANVP